MRKGCPRATLVLLALASAASTVRAHEPARAQDLTRLSLEELMNVEVTSAQGTANRLQSTPAAMYVITGEEIRRSGHRTLAEALRMVPGMFVGRGGSSFWRVGARGFTGSGITSTKQLVMIDGRIVYDPLFSGTFWDVQDLILIDIDRIEVIRGPGATLWGVNAMNGVINVITRSARETTSSVARVGSGTTTPGFASARHGAQLGDATWYRVYGKYAGHDAFEDADGNAIGDDWGIARGGFRLDHERRDGVEVTVAGDVYRSTRYGTVDSIPVPDAHLARTTLRSDGMVGGASLRARAEKAFDVRNGWALQAYYDRTEREQTAGFQVDRDTFDVDYRRWLSLGDRHELIYGAQTNWTSDETKASPVVAMSPASRTWGSANLFVQDTIELVDHHWFAMLGTKVTYHDFVGFEWQPTARLWWTPTHSQTAWFAATRSSRVPSRFEEDAVITAAYVDTGLAAGLPATGVHAPLTITGNDELLAERATSLEAGYRMQVNERWSIDLALFDNDYRRLIALPQGNLGPFTNERGGLSRGVEVATSIRPFDRWRLEGSVSWLEVDSEGPAHQYEDDNTPQRLAQLRSYLDVSDHWELNAAAYYVDELPLYGIEDYTRLDVGVTWHASDRFDLAVTGQNLLERRHRETGDVEVPRAVYAEAVFRW